MNIYGDTGNIIALKKRAQWRGIDTVVKNISVGDKLKKGDVDIFFFGGGQDQAQQLVASDLESSGKGKIIKQEVERGIPLLSICGGYQLLGEYYQPHKGPKLPGVGLFPIYTEASNDRMIGNLVIKLSDSLKTDDYLVGFENHSGKTYLRKEAVSLGLVTKGFGNNGKDKTEGCLYKNAIGCYLHGSLLPKNPKLADWFLQKALEVKYGSPRFAGEATPKAGEAGKKIKLKPLDDTLELQAHHKAISRFS